MAAKSDADKEYIVRVEKMDWVELSALWDQIKAGKAGRAEGWEDGKALEHLVVRAFRLSRLQAEYPFDVPPGGRALEEIDGLVVMGSNTFLLECKDMSKVAIEVIAKLINQLLRRPGTTLGCVFTSGGFTSTALLLADFSVPHRILLWSGRDIEEGLKGQNFHKPLSEKYLNLCKYGLTDHSPNYEELEVQDEPA
jgi:hypothetical protein